ncbi:MAG: sporulation protein YunB [Clostridiales bacterium]|nr:sporulation protein YunB [Clostridiales bacterium]
MRYTVVSTSAKQNKRRKLIARLTGALVVIVVLAIILALWIYWRSMTPTILSIAQTRLISETTMAVNDAVCVALADSGDFKNFVSIERNDNNDITMITANSALVNLLARNTAIMSQSKINAINAFEVNIPLGTLSGIPLLSEKGPTVTVTVSPIGAVNCTFTSTFETAGINQTLHRIYIYVESKVDLIMPTSHLEVETTTPVLICESVIIGTVPDVFLQGGLLLGTA